MVIKLWSTSFVLLLKNRPIKKLYLLDMTFWLDGFFFHYVYKTRTWKFLVYAGVVEIIGFISLYLWLSSILWKNVICFCFMDWEKFVWSRVLLFLAFWSKTFRYEFYTRSGKKNHPIRKSYLINTAFWLVDFCVGVQNWYFKALWPWGLEYWNLLLIEHVISSLTWRDKRQ
jgi:hypothetical protein